MADIRGAEIEIRVKRDQIRKDIDDALRDPFGFKAIQKQGQAQFANFTSGIREGLLGPMGVGGGTGAGGAAGGMAGTFGKMLGVLSLVNIGIGAAVSLLGPILDQLKASSPALKGTFMLFDKAFNLFFKPFGDFLSVLLRPLAYVLLKFAIDFNRLLAPVLMALAPLLQSLFKPAVEVGKDVLKGGVDVAGDIAKSLVGTEEQKKKIDEAVANLKTIIDDPVKAVMSLWQDLHDSDVAKAIRNAIDTAGTVISDALAGLSPWVNDFIKDPFGTLGKNFQEISDWWTKNIAPAITSFKTWATSAWTGVTDWWNTNIQPHVEDFKKWAKDLWKGFTDWWNTNIQPSVDNFKTLWSNFWSGITGWLNENTVWNSLKSAVKGFINALISAINSAIDWLSHLPGAGIFNLGQYKLQPLQSGSEYIPNTGPYMLHRGEKVISASNQDYSKQMAITNNIYVTAQVSNNYDVQALANDITERMNVSLRSKLGYGSGFI